MTSLGKYPWAERREARCHWGNIPGAGDHGAESSGTELGAGVGSGSPKTEVK